MESTPEFFRNAVKEFKAADALFSSQLKLHQDAASAMQTEVTNKSAAAEYAANGYMQAVERMDSPPENISDADITPEIEAEVGKLKTLAIAVKSSKDELDAIRQRSEILKSELAAALSQERAARRSRNIRRVLIAGTAVGVLIAWHFWLLTRTTLSFAFSLDGKDFPPEITPAIAVDDKPFASESRINLGRHQIIISFTNGETFTKKAWVFYGKNDLGILPLETSKGSLLVAVKPAPATVAVKLKDKMLYQSDAPLRMEKLPVGSYTLLIRRGDYEEKRAVKIDRQLQTATNIDLNLGAAQLLSVPADADFNLSGNGRHWEGKLPQTIEDIPSGTYWLAVSRKGWGQSAQISIHQGNVATNIIEFPYGSIELTSEPTGLAVATNGVEIGKTPITIKELKPGRYSLSASDGENDLIADLDVASKEAIKHNFAFHYGTVEVITAPVGATVFRKGKEVGKTPLTLNHVPAGDVSVELSLHDYVSTNLQIHAVEGIMTNVSARLISERYVRAMRQAHEAFYGARYAESQAFLTSALEFEPNDPVAMALQDTASKAAAKAEETRKEAARIAEIAQKEAERKEIEAIIEKSIAAVGGRDVINKFKSVKLTSHTSGTVKGNQFSMRLTLWAQLPDTIRIDQTIDNSPKKLGPLTLTVNEGRPAQSTLCVTPNGSWEIVPGILGGSPMQLSSVGKAAKEDLLTSLYSANCMTMIPLLDSDYTLEKLPSTPSTPLNSVGIKVRKAGRPNLTMYFEKDSGLLEGMDTDKVDSHGNLIHSSERYSDYRNFSGLMHFTTTQYKADGGTFSTDIIDSFEPLVQYYGNVFAEPPKRQY